MDAASVTLICSAGLGSEINADYIDGFVKATGRKDLKPVLAHLFRDQSLVSRAMVEDLLKYKRLDGVQDFLTELAGNLFREGRQAEVGVKLEPAWLHGGTMTLAYFDLEEKNALAADASNIQRQVGKRTNRGVELQADFRIQPATAVKASFTHNDSRQDVSVSQSLRTPLIPRNQASLWVSHRFGSDLTVAAGARYNGSTVDEAYYPGRKIAAYTLLDLMVRYDINRAWALQLNARNLTDKTYVSGCDFYCYYGGSRTLDLQLQYQWK